MNLFLFFNLTTNAPINTGIQNPVTKEIADKTYWLTSGIAWATGPRINICGKYDNRNTV